VKTTHGVSESGAAGTSPAYGTVGTITLKGRYDWLSLQVGCVGATLTGFRVERQASVGGDWLPWLAGTDFADASQLAEGEESGVDDAGNGHYVYQLATTENGYLKLRVTGVYAVRISAIGAGATVAVAGTMVGE